MSGVERRAADVHADSATAGRIQTSDQPVGELVSQAAEQISALVRAELRLAVTEVTDKGRHAGIGLGLFGGASVTALYGVGAVVAAAIAALALVTPVWAAALIVAVVLGALAAVLGLAGKRQVARAVPPIPEQAVRGAKADLKEIKERAHR